MSNRINAFFKETTDGTFYEFFKNRVNGKSYCEGMDYSERNFNEFWTEENIQLIYDTKEINIFEFLTLHFVIVRETGGTYKPISETYNGINGNPSGISYLYNSGGKSSYNKLRGNKSCYTLFNDAAYNSAHGSKPLGDILSGAGSEWNTKTMPSVANVPNSILCMGRGTGNEYVREADFFKFRGRGYIQTTGRNNYRLLVDYILKYKGGDGIINKYKARWSAAPYNSDLDNICTRSSNDDWDDLFFNTTVIGAKAIKIHANGAGLGKKSGGLLYLHFPLENCTPQKLEQYLVDMGDAINNKGYANLLGNRVLQTVQAMGY
jgi:hypothetical protein